MNIKQNLGTVLWGFVGVRSSAAHQADIDEIKVPLALPMMAFVIAAGFAGVVYSLADIAVHVVR